MKLIKKILPGLMVSILPSMSLVITSCNKNNDKLENYFEIENGTLYGFKNSVSKSDLLKRFGTALVIPKSVTSIADDAFIDTNLNSTIPNEFHWLVFENESNLSTIGSFCFLNAPFKNEIIIPKSVNTIYGGAFANSSISSVVFEKSDAEISFIAESMGVFENCLNLTSVEFPTGTEAIPEKFVKGCAALKNFTIPSNVKAIEKESFSGTGLKSIKLPANVKNIEIGAFSSCTYLEEIDVSEHNNVFSNLGQFVFNGTSATGHVILSSDCSNAKASVWKKWFSYGGLSNYWTYSVESSETQSFTLYSTDTKVKRDLSKNGIKYTRFLGTIGLEPSKIYAYAQNSDGKILNNLDIRINLDLVNSSNSNASNLYTFEISDLSTDKTSSRVYDDFSIIIIYDLNGESPWSQTISGWSLTFAGGENEVDNVDATIIGVCTDPEIYPSTEITYPLNGAGVYLAENLLISANHSAFTFTQVTETVEEKTKNTNKLKIENRHLLEPTVVDVTVNLRYYDATDYSNIIAWSIDYNLKINVI